MHAPGGHWPSIGSCSHEAHQERGRQRGAFVNPLLQNSSALQSSWRPQAARAYKQGKAWATKGHPRARETKLTSWTSLVDGIMVAEAVALRVATLVCFSIPERALGAVLSLLACGVAHARYVAKCAGESRENIHNYLSSKGPLTSMSSQNLNLRR